MHLPPLENTLVHQMRERSSDAKILGYEIIEALKIHSMAGMTKGSSLCITDLKIRNFSSLPFISIKAVSKTLWTRLVF